MEKSIFFDDNDIIESYNYKTSIRVDALLNKIKDMCAYKQEYIYSEVVELKRAEEILIAIREICNKG